MSLVAIERELVLHAQAERRRWQEIAQLLMRVEREALWKASAPSFTAWLKGVARKADLQESVFWRCLKAGRIYLELTGAEGLDDELEVSAESLELADKIRRHAPRAVTQEITERTLNGELTRNELREVWATYRPAAGGATARGRLPEDPEAREDAIEARKALWEAQKRKPETRAEVQRGEMLSAFRAGTFLGSFDQARAEPRVTDHQAKLSSVLVVRRDVREPSRLELHGLFTCAAKPELDDYEFGATRAMDYVWLAVPGELGPQAISRAPRMVGVLGLSRGKTFDMMRPAQRRNLDAQARLDMLAMLLARAYVWP